MFSNLDASHSVVIINLIGLVISTISLAVTGIWKLSQMDMAMRQTLAEHLNEIENKIDSHKDKVDQDFSIVNQGFAAVRQKINDVELYMRDTYIQKSSFTEVVNRISGEIAVLGDRIEKRLQRIEDHPRG